MDDLEIGHIVIRSCSSKGKHSKASADLMIEKIAREKGEIMYYYNCSVCFSYHLTSREPDERIQERVRRALLDRANKVSEVNTTRRHKTYLRRTRGPRYS